MAAGPSVLQNVLLVAAGGGLGSAVRFGLMRLAFLQWGAGFAYATLLPNVLGCILLGVLVGVNKRPEAWMLFLGTGLAGGLTTFSSWVLELNNLLKTNVLHTLGYAVLSLLAGLGLLMLAAWATRALS